MLYVALTTPFDARGRVLERSLIAHLRWLASKRVEGFWVLSPDGEGCQLELDERGRVIELAVRERGGGRILAGLGAQSLWESRHAVAVASDAGAHAAVLELPPGNGLPRRGVVRYIEAVLEASHIPVYLLHDPGVRAPVDTDLVVPLSAHPRLRGVVDRAGDPTLIQSLADRFEGLELVAANDRALLVDLRAGARSVASPAAALFPDAVRDVLRGADRWAAQRRLSAIVDAAVGDLPVASAYKALIAAMGLGCAEVLPPLRSIDAAERELVESALEQAGVELPVIRLQEEESQCIDASRF